MIETEDKIRTHVSPIRNLNLTGSPKRSLSMLMASDTCGVQSFTARNTRIHSKILLPVAD